MSVKQVQNFYKDTVKTAWTAGAGNFYVSTAKPTVAPGFLVVSPGDASKREIIYYTATGTDGGGDYITVSSAAHRGLGGTTAQIHAVGEKIRMNLTAQNWQEVIDELATKYGPGITVPTPTLPGDTVNKDYADSLAIAGSPNASTSVKGISKLTATPMKSLGTATITIATPGVITLASHGLIAGDTIELTTSGALPTGLSASTTYFVISTGLTANDFQVSLSNGGAAINTSGSQSGTHTLYRTTPYAVSDQDARIPTQAENDALAGTSGSPSSSNKYVTNDDTTGTGSLLRLSALGGEIYEKTFTAGENITAGQPLHYSEYAQLNPITVDASTSAHSFSAGATHNCSVTIANQSNRLLIVDLECDGGATISSVTYNSVSMTLIDSQAAPSSGNIIRSYRLTAPTVGTANVTVTTSGGSIPTFGLAIMATSYYNVDQTTPVEATAKSSTSGGGTFSHSISTLTGGALVHASYAFNATSGTSTITFDSVSGLNAINIASSFGAAKARSPVSETVQSVTVDNTHSTSINRAVLLLAIKPSEAQSPRVQKASATAATAFVEVKQNFVGFAKETITAGNTIKVQTGGIITGLSGLSIGKYYYIQDTAGNLGLSAGTVSKIACKAISATSAVIAI